MASAADNGTPVMGRVDAAGRLVEADPMLADLQAEAGSSIGARLALPQLAAIARLVRKLGITVSRPAIVAARDHDLELWVRGEPQGEDVLLWIDQWKRRPPAPPRIELAVTADDLIGGALKDSWATDAELRFTSLSPDLASLIGVDPADATGKPLTALLRLEEGEDGDMPLLTALASRTDFAGQLATSRGSTKHRLVLNGEAILAEGGGFGGFRGRALAEHVAIPEAANEGVTAATIDPALDQALRSPLDRIIAAAEGIVERADGPLRSDYAEYAGDIAAAARHLLSVIRAIVDQPAEASASLDLAALAAEAINLVQPQAEERPVSLVQSGESALDARGDARGIIQILVNLLGNAVRHSPESGTVTVKVARRGDRAEISVIDQGKGIAPEDQERIFEKFERIGNGGGAGLGLAIARRLARSMGGDVSLVSAPGEGARFTLSLPAA
jgi:signal transduction histidine kinase